MSDQNVLQLTATDVLDGGDLLYVGVDPAGTPADRAATLDTVRHAVATTIHQLADRSWSAAVLERDADAPRIELRGWDDPADATNGVDGAEHITDLDVWLDLNEFGIDPPWEA